jgi:hypothetical protein
MTLDEVAKLDLTPVTSGGLSFNSTFPNAVGVDSTGNRIQFSVFFIDRPAIAQLQKRVRTVCSVGASGWMANTKASDGRPILISLRPLLVDGKSQFTVVGIRRTLTKTMTAAQKKELGEQLREKYGDFYDSNSGGLTKRRMNNVIVTLDFDLSQGYVIQLSMPSSMFSAEIRQQLMEQPGCTEKLKVD